MKKIQVDQEDYEMFEENAFENPALAPLSTFSIEWVDKLPTNVSLLMLHGNADWRVKCEQSLKLAIEFEKYRIPYRLVIFEGSDHGINENKNEVNKMVLNWFDRFLKNNEPLPDMKYHGR